MRRFDAIHSLKKVHSPLAELNGRAREVSLPIYAISPDCHFREEFLKSMTDRNKALSEENPAKIVLEALRSVANRNDCQRLHLKEIAREAEELARNGTFRRLCLVRKTWPICFAAYSSKRRNGEVEPLSW